MARIQRFASLGLVLVLLSASGCTPGKPEGPPHLTKEEIRLVEETLTLIRIRIESTRDPGAADSMRASLGDLYTEQEREFLLDRLAKDSARGELVMSALHDSLQAMREVLFPPTDP
jgi:hypothetical protein